MEARMSTQNVSEEISQIDSFLRQLRGGVPPVLTKDADEFQKPPPVATTTPQGNNLAQSSGRFGAKCVSSCIC